jgi:hypothetical protein
MFSSLVSPRERFFSFSLNEKHFCYLENVGNFCGGCQCGAGALIRALSIRRAISRHCTARTGMVADAASSLTTASGRAMWWS